MFQALMKQGIRRMGIIHAIDPADGLIGQFRNAHAPVFDTVVLDCHQPVFARIVAEAGGGDHMRSVGIRAEDDSVEFNLMKEGVLDEIGEFITELFKTDLDRILGLFYFAYHPQVARHMSGGHRFMSLAGSLSVLRGNFAGGGGNCGYHSRAFAGLASHLKINGQPLKAHTVGIYGHVISAVGWRGSKALMDADAGHFMLTPDGSDLATIEEFRTNPGVLTTAGPGDLARYFTFDFNHTAGYPGIVDKQFPGVFPPGAPKA
jgi:hypothetical protein